jgi:predicted HAD superfamily phosphohydrolase YqeG
MTKNNTVEKIDQIIKKIEENSSKSLNDKEVRKLLNDIDDKLTEVKENAKEEQKEMVSEKVEELKDKIDESRSKK